MNNTDPWPSYPLDPEQTLTVALFRILARAMKARRLQKEALEGQVSTLTTMANNLSRSAEAAEDKVEKLEVQLENAKGAYINLLRDYRERVAEGKALAARVEQLTDEKACFEAESKGFQRWVEADSYEAAEGELNPRIRELEEALAFYASIENHTIIELGATAIQKDGGARARKALKGGEKREGLV